MHDAVRAHAERSSLQGRPFAASRAGGVACRYSGRRLGLLVPETDRTSTGALAREVVLDLGDDPPAVSTGVAAWEAGESGEQVVARARLALAVREVTPPPPT